MGLKKTILASTAFFLGMMQLNAKPTHLTVELNSGDKYSFLLDDNLSIRYDNPSPTYAVNYDYGCIDDDAIWVASDKTSFSIYDVKEFYFTKEDLTEVESVSIPKNEIRIISLDDATLQIQNLQSKSMVAVINMSGALLSSVYADSEGTAVVSLPHTKGIYIVSISGRSFKIIRK